MAFLLNGYGYQWLWLSTLLLLLLGYCYQQRRRVGHNETLCVKAQYNS